MRQGIIITPDPAPASNPITAIVPTPAIPNPPENEPAYCGMNIADVNDEVSLYSASQKMAILTNLNLVPLPRTVNHWVELCSGGMVAGLTAALTNSITVKFVTLIEKNRTVRFLANTRIISLHHQHPALLPMSAISKPFQL